MFLFPATAAILLKEHTFMSEVAVANALRNYRAAGTSFTIKSDKPGNHHYYVQPSNGGFTILPTQLPTGYMR